MVRWIKDVEGVSNFRDLQTANFPSNLVFRSADLSSMPKEGLSSLSRYIDTIIDVRSMPEIRRSGTVGEGPPFCSDEDLRLHAIKRLHCPIFLEKDYSPEAIAKRHNLYVSGEDGFVAAYRGIFDHLGPTLKIIFRELARIISAGESRGLLVHCTAGKDRTGIICALLLLLAGISPAVVAEEYALTTEGLAHLKGRVIDRLGSTSTQAARDGAMIMMSSEAPVMARTIEVLNDDYGGVEAFCQQRVDPDDYRVVLAKLRQASPVTSVL